MEFSLKVFVTAALQGSANLPTTPASSYLELNKQKKMEGQICSRHIQRAMISNLPFLNASPLLRAHPCQKEDKKFAQSLNSFQNCSVFSVWMKKHEKRCVFLQFLCFSGIDVNLISGQQHIYPTAYSSIQTRELGTSCGRRGSLKHVNHCVGAGL